MLRELSVQNLALIEDVRVELGAGLCAWTGETGAGKSLLLSALGLLTGGRGSAELIRSGADELRVVGRFELPSASLRAAIERALGRPADDDQIILTRRLNRAGRGYAYVDDEPAALATLRALGDALVDVHGQRESQSLLEPAYQLELLDAYGGLEAQRAAYAEIAGRVRAARERRRTLVDRRQQRQRDLALARFERAELDQASLIPGEASGLERERERLTHAGALADFCTQAAGVLYDEDDSVVERLGRLRHDADGWAAVDPALAEAAQRLLAATSEVQDLASDLRHRAAGYEPDPERLDEVNRRLSLIRRLETKYGKSADELIEYRSGLEAQEAGLLRKEEDAAAIEGEITMAYAELRKAAAELHAKRLKIARRFATEAQKHLAELGMREARLEAVLEERPLGDDPFDSEVHSAGIDRLELTLAANPGEPALPLRRVASGGELSRAMLAVKSVLAGQDPVGTLVFDEIDANVGGRLGDVLGRKLAALGRTHQVICVTHLPQVAAYAAEQWSIRKQVRAKRSVTTIRMLDRAGRIEELAEMIRGAPPTEGARKEAAAMLADARKATTA